MKCNVIDLLIVSCANQLLFYDLSKLTEPRLFCIHSLGMYIFSHTLVCTVLEYEIDNEIKPYYI